MARQPELAGYPGLLEPRLRWLVEKAQMGNPTKQGPWHKALDPCAPISFYACRHSVYGVPDNRSRTSFQACRSSLPGADLTCVRFRFATSLVCYAGPSLEKLLSRQLLG